MRNDPVDFGDPSGQNAQLIAIGVGALVGGGVALLNAYLASEGTLTFQEGMKAVLVGAATGVGTAFIATTPGIPVAVVAGATGGFAAVGSAVYQLAIGTDPSNLNLTSVGLAGLVGTLGGAYGAGVVASGFPVGPVAGRLAVAGGLTSPYGALAATLSHLYPITPEEKN